MSRPDSSQRTVMELRRALEEGDLDAYRRAKRKQTGRDAVVLEEWEIKALIASASKHRRGGDVTRCRQLFASLNGGRPS